MKPLVLETKLDKVAWRFGWLAFTGRGMAATDSDKNVGVAVVEVFVVAEEVVDDEFPLLDMIRRSCSATPHLLVEYRNAHPAAHYQMENFPAVEAGIEHADTDGYLRILLAFELADEIIGVGNVAGDNLGVAPF